MKIDKIKLYSMTSNFIENRNEHFGSLYPIQMYSLLYNEFETKIDFGGYII